MPLKIIQERIGHALTVELHGTWTRRERRPQNLQIARSRFPAPEKARKRSQLIREHFLDAVVGGSEVLIPATTIDDKNRHALAAAVRAGAEVIVTLSLKDFPTSALQPFRVEARHPDRFFIELFDLKPEVIIHSLHEQAGESNRSLEDLLQILVRVVPDFVILVGSNLRHLSFMPNATELG